MTQGWIKVDRSLLEHGIFADGDLLRVWMYCLLKANHKARKVPVGRQMVELQPGQLLYGRKAVSQQLNMGEGKLRAVMGQLVQCGSIEMGQQGRQSVVTVVNWNFYQKDNAEEEAVQTADDSQNAALYQPEERQHKTIQQPDENQHETAGQPDENQIAATDQPDENQMPATDKNVKKVKNIKHDKHVKNDKNAKQETRSHNRAEQQTGAEGRLASAQSDGPAGEQPVNWRRQQDIFERLWQLYPIKKGRYKLTKTQIAQVVAQGEARMEQAIRRYCQEKQGQNREYWMHGSTFFAGGYQDYLPEEVEAQRLSANLQEDSRWEGLF